MRYRAAVVQTTTTENVAANLEAAEDAVRAAAKAGAKLVALPEAVSFIGGEAAKAAAAEPPDGPSFRRFEALAAELDLYLLAGSLPERVDGGPPANTSVLYGPQGALATYRKIHLFDVDLGPEGPRLAESDGTQPGAEAVSVETPLGTMGLTICYDLRFPELYVSLRSAGAELLFVPSAFTVPTGADHWEVLLRARAIETQCYVLAPAQIGAHGGKRRSYGRSMIIDPWGTVLATAPDRPSLALADLDLDHLRDLRRKMPCETHRSGRKWSPREGVRAHRRG